MSTFTTGTARSTSEASPRDYRNNETKADAPRKSKRYRIFHSFFKCVTNIALELPFGPIKTSSSSSSHNIGNSGPSPVVDVAECPISSPDDIYDKFEDALRLSRLEEPVATFPALRLLVQTFHPNGRTVHFPVPLAVDQLQLASVGLPTNPSELMELTRKVFSRRGLEFSIRPQSLTTLWQPTAASYLTTASHGLIATPPLVIFSPSNPTLRSGPRCTVAATPQPLC